MSTFRDEMQYIFSEKSFVFMVILAVKDAGTDVTLILNIYGENLIKIRFSTMLFSY